MAIPDDKEHVSAIIEKRYVRLINQFADHTRVSKSRAVRDLVIDALHRRFSLPDGFLEDTEGTHAPPTSFDQAA